MTYKQSDGCITYVDSGDDLTARVCHHRIRPKLAFLVFLSFLFDEAICLKISWLNAQFNCPKKPQNVISHAFPQPSMYQGLKVVELFTCCSESLTNHAFLSRTLFGLRCGKLKIKFIVPIFNILFRFLLGR